MPRNNNVKRSQGKVLVSIDSIQHTLTEAAFIEFMEQALNVMQGLVASKTHAELEKWLARPCPVCKSARGIPCVAQDGKPCSVHLQRRTEAS